MRAAVIGLGKIGLPLATTIADAGIPVVGGDASPRVVEAVNAAREPFPGEPGLSEALGRVIPAGTLRATVDNGEAATGADVVVIVVPMFVDGEGVPDYSILESASRDVGAVLAPGQTVVYETTLPVGATRGVLTPFLEEASGLTAGDDFHVVHSPERVFSGRVFADLRRYPKLVGGLTPACAERAVAFYEQALTFDDRPDLDRSNGVWNLDSLEAAEFAKLAETTYRDVNIALANEFARFAEEVGVDVHAVIEASNSQPFSHIHRPGIYVGGHCIPVYPRFYSSVDPAAVLPRVAREINDGGPDRAVERLAARLGSLSGRTVGVLGAAYRGAVKETAFSGVFPLVAGLTSAGATAIVHDPMYAPAELEAIGLAPWSLGDPVDAVVVQADHPEYRELGPDDLGGPSLVLDGRRVLDPARFDDRLLVIGEG